MSKKPLGNAASGGMGVYSTEYRIMNPQNRIPNSESRIPADEGGSRGELLFPEFGIRDSASSSRACRAAQQVLKRHLQLPQILLRGVVGRGADLVALDRLEIAHRHVDLLKELRDLGGLDRLARPVPLVELLVPLLDLLHERFSQRVEQVDE